MRRRWRVLRPSGGTVSQERLMFRLIPKEEKFFDMFISMAENAHEAAKLLVLMMDKPSEIKETAESIKALEHKGKSRG